MSIFSIGTWTPERPPVVAPVVPPERPPAPVSQPASSKDRPEELLSIAAISRKLDVNYATLARVLRKEHFMPDFMSHDVPLFRPSRLAEIKSLVKR